MIRGLLYFNENLKECFKIKNEIQGDDSLFMNLCKKQEKIKIIYADDSYAHVFARQEKRWISLLLQRLRWAGDANIMWKFNPMLFLMVIATFFSNLFINSLIEAPQ